MINLLVLLIVVLETHASLDKVYRLPTSVKPTHYDLKLKFDTNVFYTYGHVNIKITCVRQTRKISLHVNQKHGLTFSKYEVEIVELKKWEEEVKVNVDKVNVDGKFMLLEIDLKENLVEGKEYILKIPFQRDMLDPVGLIKFKNENKYFFASNFQRTQARAVFPCFDDPAIKAKFRLTIERKKEASSKSNMMIEKTVESKDGWVLDIYNETPPISTYQVAFVIHQMTFSGCNYDYHSVKHVIPVTYWQSGSSQSKECQAGADLVGACFYALIDKIKLPTTINHVLQKIDFLVLPIKEKIHVTAPGLIIIREDDLTYFHDKESQELSHFVYKTLATQWFEASISPDWWDSQWLLSSLANFVPFSILSDDYYKYKIVSKIFHTLDSTSGRMDDITDIGEQEDSSFKLLKGIMLLHMVRKSITGDDGFMRGARFFASEHQNNYASVDHFWNLLDELNFGDFMGKSEQGITAMMHSWTDQPGYPMIKVRRIGTDVEVFQTHYWYATVGPNDQCWWIPLTYTTAANLDGFNNTMATQWLGCNGKRYNSIKMYNVVQKNHWIVFNNQMAGLYRVNYDQDSWNMIIKTLTDKEEFLNIHPLNRDQLVNDVLDLSYKGHLDFNIAFRLLSYMNLERELFVWKTFFNGILRLKKELAQSPLQDDIKRFIKSVVSKEYDVIFPSADRVLRYIRNEDETQETNYKKQDDYEAIMHIHRESCESGVSNCIFQSKEIILKWKTDGLEETTTLESFPYALVSSVLYTSVREDDKSSQAFEFVFNKVQTLKGKNFHHSIFVDVLEFTRNETNVKRVLKWCTSAETSNNEETTVKLIVLGVLMAGKSTFPVLQQYFYDNFNRMNTFLRNLNTYPPYPMEEFIHDLASNMDAEQLDKLKQFVESKSTLKRTIMQEDLEVREQVDSQWIKDNSSPLKEALLKVVPK